MSLQSIGVVTAVSFDNGKAFDVDILSKSCKVCTSMKKLPLLISLVTWELSHNCNLNYIGCSTGMESAEATKIFNLTK